MNIQESIARLPEQLRPDVEVPALNAPVRLQHGPLRLRWTASSAIGTIESDLWFRWLPFTAVEFEGSYEGPERPTMSAAFLQLPDSNDDIPVLVTGVRHGSSEPMSVRGVLQQGWQRWNGDSITELRFSLINFPSYLGEQVKATTSGGVDLFPGRMELRSLHWIGMIDEMSESRPLRVQCKKEPGFYLSHTGVVRPAVGQTSPSRIRELLEGLHAFFGLLRGAWCGPFFPRGYSSGKVAWEQFGAWVADQPREVESWLPVRHQLSVGGLFATFITMWESTAWHQPLINAVSWYVASNDPRTSMEGSLVMSQVALEMLSWVVLVEVEALYKHEQFDRLSAHRRLRKLLAHLRIGNQVPRHMSDLENLAGSTLKTDAPGSVVRIRNALVHSTIESRRLIAKITPQQLWEASQLSIQYLELALLALLKYRGKYSRRCWRGYKGEDEIEVPWN